MQSLLNKTHRQQKQTATWTTNWYYFV